jgi:hydrogenase nickel incorporation protein HypA/HybF
MHEIAIVSSLFEIINRQVAEHGIESISRVHLKVGELAALEPMTLTACFETLALGTAAEGAQLTIETLPVTARCGPCGTVFRVIKYQFQCPDCHSDTVQLVGGKELYIDSLEATCQGECHEKTAA